MNEGERKMEINYHLTEEDYLNFNMYHVKNSKAAMKSLNLQRFLSPVFFIIFAYMFSSLVEIEFLGIFITFLVISILWIIFYPKYFYAHVRRQTKKMIQEGENEGLLGSHHLLMTEEGIIETTSSGETRVNWSSLKDFKEDDDNFYIYNSGLSAIILPKRILTKIDQVRSYIESKIV